MAGTVTITKEAAGHKLERVTLAWVSDASGDVSGNLQRELPGGVIRQVKFVPDGGGTAPTDLYDVTLVDEDGADLLLGAGADLSATVASISAPANKLVYDKQQALDLVVANAGISKGGTVVLWFGPVGG
jgi:hypothetical protein